jgi:polysaccharide export outer membrane protein
MPRVVHIQNRLKSQILIFCVATIVVGCGSNPSRTDVAAETANRAAPAAEYAIGPGDELQIFVWEHEELSTNVQVRPDGMLSTPLVEDMQASGKTPTRLARDIEGVLSEYVRNPVVTVIVEEFRGDVAQQVRVVGQAVEPRALQYRDGMTVLDVLIEVGGLNEFAAGNRAKLVRQTAQGQEEIRVRLGDLLNDGDMSENVRIRPGDVLIIPQSLL